MAFYTKLDQVADTLRERILSGQYERGIKLKQADIAAELGVSITPVREALKALEMEGYVASQPHKGLCVTQVNPNEVQEIMELRRILEAKLTRKAVERMTPENLDSLITAQMGFAMYAKAGDVLGARAANVKFHFKLYELADRPQTLQFVRLLWAKYPFNYSKQQTARLLNIVEEHNAFLQCVRDRDVDAAVRAMCEHIDMGWSRVEKMMNEE